MLGAGVVSRRASSCAVIFFVICSLFFAPGPDVTLSAFSTLDSGPLLAALS